MLWQQVIEQFLKEIIQISLTYVKAEIWPTKIDFKIDYDRVGKITQKIIDITEKYGVMLAYENVHWCYYNYIGFFNEIKKA